MHRPARSGPAQPRRRPLPGPRIPRRGQAGAGADLLVRDLTRGAVVSFGNVAAFAWQDKDGGHLLAMVVHAEGDLGRSVQLYDPATGLLRVLDSGGASYSGLAWRKDSTTSPSSAPEPCPTARSRPRSSSPGEASPTPRAAEDARPHRRRLPRRYPGRRLPAAEVGQHRRGPLHRHQVLDQEGPTRRTPRPRRTRRRTQGGEGQARGLRRRGLALEGRPDHPRAEAPGRARPPQERAGRLVARRRRGRPARPRLGRGGHPPRKRPAALAVNETPHDASRMFGRPYVDAFVIDTRTGERKAVAERLAHLVGPSPGGRYVLSFRDGQYHAYDVETGKTECLTAGLKSTFADDEDDHPTPERAPYPLGGLDQGGRDGPAPRPLRRLGGPPGRLQGDPADSRARGGGRAPGRPARRPPARPGPPGPGRASEPPEAIDRAKPIYLAVHGEWTKKQGLAVLDGGERPRRAARLARPLGLPAGQGEVGRRPGVRRPGVRRLPGPLRRRRLAEGRTPGDRDQPLPEGSCLGPRGAGRVHQLAGRAAPGGPLLPGRIQAGQDVPDGRPHLREALRGLHNYSVPSERSAYNPSVFTSRGYFFFSPDITFRPRDPGVSILDSVESGVKRVLDSGRSIASGWG